MTVSRVINGESNVRPATRDSVNAAIEALNYAPNSAARTLAGAGQNRIGLLYSNPSGGYLSEILVGTLDQASKRDVQLIVQKCEVDTHETDVARYLIEGGIDAMILPSPLSESPALVRMLVAEGVPAVLLGSEETASGLLTVTIDNRQAAWDMTRHIIGLGHRRIGFIIGNPAQSDSLRRLEGYRAAMEEAGLGGQDELVTQGYFDYKSGLDAAELLLDLPDPPTAIFASNDDMAAASVAVAHRRGLDVPGDLTVCGFDDTTLATAIWPELTTIRQPIADMARAAVELLVGALRRQPTNDAERHRRLDVALIRRQSDAAPRRRPKARA